MHIASSTTTTIITIRLHRNALLSSFSCQSSRQRVFWVTCSSKESARKARNRLAALAGVTHTMAGLGAADLGSICDTEHVRRYPPDGADVDRAFRNFVARDIYWHPPLVKPDRETLRARCATFAQRMQHPRAAIISASTSARLMYTCQMWDATSGCHGLRLPPCEGCGMPTGYFCSGIAPTDRRHGFDCRIAVRTICSVGFPWNWTNVLSTVTSAHARTRNLVQSLLRCCEVCRFRTNRCLAHSLK
jgi:hypothetical protein